MMLAETNLEQLTNRRPLPPTYTDSCTIALKDVKEKEFSYTLPLFADIDGDALTFGPHTRTADLPGWLMYKVQTMTARPRRCCFGTVTFSGTPSTQHGFPVKVTATDDGNPPLCVATGFLLTVVEKLTCGKRRPKKELLRMVPGQGIVDPDNCPEESETLSNLTALSLYDNGQRPQFLIRYSQAGGEANCDSTGGDDDDDNGDDDDDDDNGGDDDDNNGDGDGDDDDDDDEQRRQ